MRLGDMLGFFALIFIVVFIGFVLGFGLCAVLTAGSRADMESEIMRMRGTNGQDRT